MSYKRDAGKTGYLNKRVPQNPKYEHIKTKLDTGCSVTKYLEGQKEIKKYYRYQKDELFKRLKVTTFAQMVIQVATVSEQNESLNGEQSAVSEGCLSVVSDAKRKSVSELTNGSPQASPVSLHVPDHNSTADTSGCLRRSTLQNVISGVGQLDLKKKSPQMNVTPMCSPHPADGPYPDCPYLLLDVRDREEYDCCHIISAYSYPITTLHRAINPYTREVLDYRNAPEKIIILYDEDERRASEAATAMCQRGFENLFMLSGGLKLIGQTFPEGLTTGSFPPSCLPSPTSAAGKKKKHCPSQQSLQAAENRWRFTSDELAKIQQQLDKVFTSSNYSHMSSRMSISSAQSKASSARSRQSS
ncbi:centrosomal protein of 41 kDa isoform X2 [Myripristis murdjan]|uniref:Centrosomal protein 41 n=1 Tax=Myripristis murdjan TaxID=586833 RepID=A0A667Y5G7_9TELE|nr:centrosomal protein of 41 kDa isoform X2 [Myripristis murdjan]